MIRPLLFPALLALALQGCLFGGNKKDPDSLPMELPRIESAVKVENLWKARVGGGSEYLRLGLRPSSDGSRVFAASYDGTVSGFAVASGQRDWSIDTRLKLTAGPGYGDGLVVVGSADGDVVAIDAANGEERWRQAVASELLAVPLVAANTVILRGVNGSLHALSAADGKARWSVEQQVPRLSLRGIGQPGISGDVVIAGFDNGRVVAYRLRDGAELWQAPLALRRGRTELERLSDIDSDIVVLGEEAYVAGFQSRAALLRAGDGQAAWVVDVSSAHGLGIDWTGIYATDGDSRVFSLSRSNGELRWEQAGLLRRGLTGPTAFGNSVVVGDFEGYLHWLSASDGTLTGRVRAGKARIVASPLAVGNRLFVQDEAGMLHTFALPETSEAG